jgi:hypothetical protein
MPKFNADIPKFIRQLMDAKELAIRLQLGIPGAKKESPLGASYSLVGSRSIATVAESYSAGLHSTPPG